jgi:phosphatidate cytidylyltransferase
MTPPPAADRPSRPGSGSQSVHLGARAAAPPTTSALWAGRDDGDTGPVPIVGSRPGPPPLRPPDDVPTAAVAPVTGEAPTAAVPAVTGEAPTAAVAPGLGDLEGEPADEGRDDAAGDPAELPTTERPAGGRAGRNLGQAIGVGLSLGGLILLSLLVWRPAFLAVVTAAVLVGVVELTRALQAGRFRPPLVPLLVGSLAMEALAWSRGETGLVIGFLLTALAVVVWRLGHGPAGYLRDASAGVLVALYVPLLAGFAVLLLAADDGATRVLAFIATVVASDVGGYTAGVLFGKHPMAPTISPKKSWEGMAGSVLGCMLVATPIVVFALDGPWWGGLLYGAAIAVSATIGDLGESLIKRSLGIKDMGNLLPGHGGLMDRLDSLLPSAAVAYLLLSLLAPVSGSGGPVGRPDGAERVEPAPAVPGVRPVVRVREVRIEHRHPTGNVAGPTPTSRRTGTDA